MVGQPALSEYSVSEDPYQYVVDDATTSPAPGAPVFPEEPMPDLPPQVGPTPLQNLYGENYDYCPGAGNIWGGKHPGTPGAENIWGDIW